MGGFLGARALRSSLGSCSESPSLRLRLQLAGHRLLDREAELGHHGGQTHVDLLHLPVLLAESCESQNRQFGVSWRVRESNPLAIKVCGPQLASLRERVFIFRPGFECQVSRGFGQGELGGRDLVRPMDRGNFERQPGPMPGIKRWWDSRAAQPEAES